MPKNVRKKKTNVVKTFRLLFSTNKNRAVNILSSGLYLIINLSSQIDALLDDLLLLFDDLVLLRVIGLGGGDAGVGGVQRADAVSTP